MKASEKAARAKAMLAQRSPTRPVWIGDDGWLRIGRSADWIEMLERLGIRTRA